MVSHTALKKFPTLLQQNLIVSHADLNAPTTNVTARLSPALMFFPKHSDIRYNYAPNNFTLLSGKRYHFCDKIEYLSQNGNHIADNSHDFGNNKILYKIQYRLYGIPRRIKKHYQQSL